MLEFNNGSFNAPDQEGYIDLFVTISSESNMYSRRVEETGETDHSFGGLLFDSPGIYETRYEMNFGLEFSVDPISIDFDSLMEADPGFDLDMDFLKMMGESSIDTSMIRDVSYSVSIQGESNLEVTPTYYQQSYLELNGAFNPGDRIVIDASALKITRNGENALHYLSGEFFDLNLGPNEIVYTDDAAARNVLIRVTHRDQFMQEDV